MNQVNILHGMLLRMGASADDVARSLRGDGVQGVRNAARFLNPIVRYCQARLLLDHYSLDVMKQNVLRIRAVNEEPPEVQMPAPVIQFLDAFNRGAYADLELPMEDT
jgi:hypothetical protein